MYVNSAEWRHLKIIGILKNLILNYEKSDIDNEFGNGENWRIYRLLLFFISENLIFVV